MLLIFFDEFLSLVEAEGFFLFSRYRQYSVLVPQKVVSYVIDI